MLMIIIVMMMMMMIMAAAAAMMILVPDFKELISVWALEIWELLQSVDKKNQLDVTFCILYFSSNSCSTCFGQPCAHHQELTTA